MRSPTYTAPTIKKAEIPPRHTYTLFYLNKLSLTYENGILMTNLCHFITSYIASTSSKG
ncbi:hypothetical protein [Nostoc sp. FACHB-280]|uniref:hypothetical protein n=1 Tax=Nostoc sp. FACHB-280 TaxID=2692839 RepID=UPI001A7E9F10|nr:hypothetical protein [Nostoc sp. FACHB-280]